MLKVGKFVESSQDPRNMINDLIISYSKGIVLFQRIPLSFSFSLSFFHIVTAFELIMTYRDDIRARLCAGR